MEIGKKVCTHFFLFIFRCFSISIFNECIQSASSTYASHWNIFFLFVKEEKKNWKNYMLYMNHFQCIKKLKAEKFINSRQECVCVCVCVSLMCVVLWFHVCHALKIITKKRETKTVVNIQSFSAFVHAVKNIFKS